MECRPAGLLTGMLTVLCAHLAEGMPFVDHFGLERCRHDSNLYPGDGVRLVLTGQGVDQCRATLGRLFAAGPAAPEDTWLNFGVAGYGGSAVDPRGAGQAAYAPGMLVWIHRVHYRGQSWTLTMQPPAGGDRSVPVTATGGCLRTVDTPETAFARPWLYDMEGGGIAGFLASGNRLSRLAIVKLVADGPGLSIREGVRLGRGLLAGNRDRIAGLGELLLGA